jgi:hypothetical protein
VLTAVEDGVIQELQTFRLGNAQVRCRFERITIKLG